MKNQYEWAAHYVDQYEKHMQRASTSGGTVVGGVELELYHLALAIIKDVEAIDYE